MDRRGILSAKGAERGGGPHFADSVRNDIFSKGKVHKSLVAVWR